MCTKSILSSLTVFSLKIYNFWKSFSSSLSDSDSSKFTDCCCFGLSGGCNRFYLRPLITLSIWRLSWLICFSRLDYEFTRVWYWSYPFFASIRSQAYGWIFLSNLLSNLLVVNSCSTSELSFELKRGSSSLSFYVTFTSATSLPNLARLDFLRYLR